MNMTRKTYWGLIGGGLIMLAVFLTGAGVDFDTKALNTTESLLLFIAGLGVLVFARMGRRTLVAYSAIAGTTLGLLFVIDLLRAGMLDLTVKLVVLVVGLVLALMASLGGDLFTYIAPTKEVPMPRVTFTPKESKPLATTSKPTVTSSKKK